jgi:outer membrane lipoprotein-sorting protein
MKSPIARIAAAAVVVVACVLASLMWKGTGSITLAQVVAKVEQMQAYLYRETGTLEDEVRGGHTTASITLVSADYGMKTDQTMVNSADGKETRMLTYVLPQQKSIVIVNVTEKEYGRIGMDDLTWENMKVENRDPREMLKRLLACEYRELGTSVIDGVKVQGFETTDPTYLGCTDQNLFVRVWVAVDTWLPVRYELELDVREGVHVSTVQDGYEWGIPVDAGEFEPDIPADFTANQADGIQMPSYSEQGLIEALQIAADFTGRYPEKLDNNALQQITQEMAAAITGEDDRPVVRQLREKIKSAGSKEAAMRASQGHFMKLMTLTMFPLMLAGQGSEPVYHGDVVTPNDVELPLMRWKTPDGQYRVIFGDLHGETVTAEVLAELEAALPQ